MEQWKVGEARGAFATLIDNANKGRPQLIVRRGKIVAAVVDSVRARALEAREASSQAGGQSVRHALERIRTLRQRAIAEGILDQEDNTGLESVRLSLDGFAEPFDGEAGE